MAKLPRLSGNEVIKTLSKAGFSPIRQKGSHVFMLKQIIEEGQENKIALVVPMHKEIDKGTLLAIIRQSKLTKEEFMKLL